MYNANLLVVQLWQDIGHNESSILQVTEQCKVRRPIFFRITLMTSGRVTLNTTTVLYDQSGSQVTVTIEVPQNVDICSLIVNISAGNSAGLSSPTEVEVGRPLYELIRDKI